MKINWKLALCLSSAGVVFAPLAQAQFCMLTNSSLSGSYGYTASQSGTPLPAASTSTSTSSSTTTDNGGVSTSANGYSTTAIGQLLGGISGGTQFAQSGVWSFDGAGNISATSTPGGTRQPIGTYTVNSDCSLSVTVADIFGNVATPVQLSGIILGHGAEIDLGVATKAPSGNSTASAPTPASGLSLKLGRVLYLNGCTLANLNGLYGFALNPTSQQSGATAQVGSVVGYLYFDGAGHIMPLPSSITSSTSSATTSATATTTAPYQYSGSYTVNPDCSGTMALNNSSTSTSTTGASQASVTVGFVIAPPSVSTLSQAGVAQSPQLNLSFSNATVSGSGYALAQ